MSTRQGWKVCTIVLLVLGGRVGILSPFRESGTHTPGTDGHLGRDVGRDDHPGIHTTPLGTLR